jgi:hypothetical protein
MNYLNSIIDDLVKYFSDRDYLIEFSRDYASYFKVFKNVDLPVDNIATTNQERLRKYKEQYLTDAYLQKYKDTEKKAIKLILGGKDALKTEV